MDSDFVLYLQEDYFFDGPVDGQRLLDIVDWAARESVPYVAVSWIGREDAAMVGEPNSLGLRRLNPEFGYLASLQAAVWERQYLQILLNRGNRLGTSSDGRPFARAPLAGRTGQYRLQRILMAALCQCRTW